VLGFSQLFDAFGALASTFLGRDVEVLTNFLLVNLYKRVDTVFHAPFDEEELADRRVVHVLLDAEKQERSATVRVKEGAMQALEGRVVRDARVNEAQVALAIANLRRDSLALGKIGHGPIVHAEPRDGTALVIERNELLAQEGVRDKSDAQQLLQLEALALLKAHVNKLVANKNGGRLVKPKRAEAFGPDCSERLLHVLVELVRLALARRAVTRALQSGDTRLLHFRCRQSLQLEAGSAK